MLSAYQTSILTSYQTSMNLKKLGFINRCYAVYFDGQVEEYSNSNDQFRLDSICTAVTVFDAVAFLLKRFNILVYFTFGEYDRFTAYFESEGSEFDIPDEHNLQRDYPTFQQALEAQILVVTSWILENSDTKFRPYLLK